jgi:16S rRNA (cytosine967-C5)-methyltransferase
VARRPGFERLSGTSRDLALEVLYNCGQDGLFAHKALLEVQRLRRPEAKARATATEMAFGTIRMALALDNIIEGASGRKTSSLDPEVLNILQLAVYQLNYMRHEAAFAVVDSAVEQAKKISNPGSSGFVNAILRKISQPGFTPLLPNKQRQPAKWLSVTQSHPLWIVEEWIARFGPDRAFAMCAYDNEAPSATIRVNTIKTNRDELIRSLAAEQKTASTGIYSNQAIRLKGWLGAASGTLFEKGMYSVQDESSMLVAEAIQPRPGELILDLCSAPGGKACHAAELSGDEAHIIACDSNEKRLELVKENAVRLGLKSIETVLADAGSLYLSYKGKADAAIADVPCSGLGVLARRPDARWRKSPQQHFECAGIGATILDSAALCLKPGGRLVFSTCTISELENEAQIESFLKRHPEFHPLPLKNLEAAGVSAPGSGFAQLLQGIHGTDGFFLALMAKS